MDQQTLLVEDHYTARLFLVLRFSLSLPSPLFPLLFLLSPNTSERHITHQTQ